MRKLLLSAGLAICIGYLVIPRALPNFLGWLKPEIVFRGDKNKRVIYLTIDDAPTSGTDAILAVLEKHKVSATFFITADRVTSDEQLRKIVQAGHSLGHHMRTTKAASKLSLEEFRKDFDFTDRVLQPFGLVRWFRPPSGFGTVAQLEYVRNRHYVPALGSVFPLDHWITQPELLQFLNRWLAVPGGIIIMHDGAERGLTTAAVLDETIPRLKMAGYEFGTLDSFLP